MIVVSPSLYVIFLISGHMYGNHDPLPLSISSGLYVLLLGGVQGQFWYIIFTMIMFVFVPFFLFLKKRTLLILGAFVFFVPLIISRGAVDLYKGYDGLIALGRLLCYHGPHFILGAVYARYESDIFETVKRSIIPLCIFSIVLSYFSFELHHNMSIVHVQKLCFCLVLIYFLSFIKNKVKVLDILANYSFCIFFLHMYIGNLVLRGTFTLLRPQNDFYKILITFLDFGITVLICVGIGWIIKKVFGKYSRMIAGC